MKRDDAIDFMFCSLKEIPEGSFWQLSEEDRTALRENANKLVKAWIDRLKSVKATPDVISSNLAVAAVALSDEQREQLYKELTPFVRIIVKKKEAKMRIPKLTIIKGEAEHTPGTDRSILRLVK